VWEDLPIGYKAISCQAQTGKNIWLVWSPRKECIGQMLVDELFTEAAHVRYVWGRWLVEKVEEAMEQDGGKRKTTKVR